MLCTPSCGPSYQYLVAKYYWCRVPHVRAASSGSVSKLSYTPQNTMDYGTLLCSAANTVGEQRDPCVFHIIMAGAWILEVSTKFRKKSQYLEKASISSNQELMIYFADKKPNFRRTQHV